MKLAIFTLLLLLPPNYSDAACLETVPFKEIGPIKIGDPPPKKVGYTKVTRENQTPGHRWFTAGAYRFRGDDQNKIDLIQFTPSSRDFCYVVEKRKIMASRTIASLALELPDCLYERNFGGDIITCNGFRLSYGDFKKFAEPAVLRIEVENRTLAQIQAETAAWNAFYQLQNEWPYRKGYPLATPNSAPRNPESHTQ